MVTSRMNTLTATMAEAAEALLSAFSPDQVGRATFLFSNHDERRRWFYTPTDHGGVPLRDLDPRQQQSVLQLLATGLSVPGFHTAAIIMGLENVLDRKEEWRARFARDRERSSRGRDPNMYYVSIFGRPGSAEPWGWRYGGHHVSVHYTILDGATVVPTPVFFGADPAESALGGGTLLRPLAGEEDRGRALLQALTSEQRTTAVISPVAPPDLVIGNRPSVEDGALPPHNRDVWRERLEGDALQRSLRLQAGLEEMLQIRPEHLEALRYSARPKGLSAAAMTATQRDLLLALAEQYATRLPDELATAEMERWSGDRLDSVHFAWAGGIEPHQPHYYRIQGPRLLIEYDNTQGGGNHVHSVWRDPDGNFAIDAVARGTAAARTEEERS